MTLLLAALLWLQDDPARFIESLGSTDPEARESAEAALIRLGTGAVPALRNAARTADLDLRSRLTAVISKIYREERRAFLRKSLSAAFQAAIPTVADAATSETAAEWQQLLGEVTGWKAVRDGDAVTFYGDTPKYAETTRREFLSLAISYAAGVWRSDAVEALIFGLAEILDIALPDPLLSMRLAFLEARNEIPGPLRFEVLPPQRGPTAIDKLDDPQARLAKGSDRGKAIDALASLTKHRDEAVRIDALRRLAALPADGKADAIIACLADDSRLVRDEAGRAIAELQFEAATEPLLRMAKTESGRALAIATLSNLGVAEAVPLLEEALGDELFQTRMGALRGLGRCRSTKSVEKILPRLKDSNSVVRMIAVRTLGEIHADSAADRLMALLKDPELRSFAAEALGMMSCETAIDALIRLLESIDAPTREAARLALLRMGRKEGLAELPRSLWPELAWDASGVAAHDAMKKVRAAKLPTRRFADTLEAVLGQWSHDTKIEFVVELPKEALAKETAIYLLPAAATLDDALRQLMRQRICRFAATADGKIRVTPGP